MRFDYFSKNPSDDLITEVFGLLGDLLVFGVLIVLFRKMFEKRREIARFIEEIDDYRAWDTLEASVRIIGNIKRLNKRGITNIDLSDCKLQHAHSIDSVSRIELGPWILSGANLNNIEFKKVFLKDSEFISSNMNVVNYHEAYFLRCEFNNLSESNWGLYHSNFDECKFEFSDIYISDDENNNAFMKSAFTLCNLSMYGQRSNTTTRTVGSSPVHASFQFIDCVFESCEIKLINNNIAFRGCSFRGNCSIVFEEASTTQVFDKNCQFHSSTRLFDLEFGRIWRDSTTKFKALFI